MTDTSYTLELHPREITGKQVKTLRADGLVPAVIHDHGKESINVQAPYLELRRLYTRAGKHHPVQLTAGGKTYTALIKDATFDPKRNELTHIVFNAVDRDQKVEAEVPVRPRYAEGDDTTPAERASLIVLTHLEAVTVHAVPADIPDVMYYPASKLAEDGDQVTVADLEPVKGVVINTDAAHSIASVSTPASLEAANAAAGGDVPDVATAEPAPTTESAAK